jgi:hypothetical protein
MFQTIRQFFVVVTRLFTACEKVAISLDNLATVGEVMSSDFVEIAKLEAAMKLSDKKAELRAIEQKNSSVKAVKSAE